MNGALRIYGQLLQEAALATRAVILAILHIEGGVTGGRVAIIVVWNWHAQITTDTHALCRLIALSHLCTLSLHTGRTQLAQNSGWEGRRSAFASTGLPL